MRCRTLRSLMILIALVAAALSTQRALANHQASIQRCQAALTQYGLLRAEYDSGYVEYERLLKASRDLMNAEYEASFGREAKINAIAAHATRAAWVLKQEEKEFSRSYFAVIADCKQFCTEAQARLAEEKAKPCFPLLACFGRTQEPLTAGPNSGPD